MKKNWTAANYPSKKVVVVQTVTLEGDEDAIAFLINNNSFRSSGVTRVLVTRDVTDDDGEVHHISNEVNLGCITGMPRYNNE